MYIRWRVQQYFFFTVGQIVLEIQHYKKFQFFRFCGTVSWKRSNDHQGLCPLQAEPSHTKRCEIKPGQAERLLFHTGHRAEPIIKKISIILKEISPTHFLRKLHAVSKKISLIF